MSTLYRQNSALCTAAVCCLCISRTSTASPQKPAAGQCLGKMCQQDTVGGVSRVGHINGTSHAGTRATAAGRISMWLLCQRCCSRRASAVLQSASPPNQIDNINKQMFCQSQLFCNGGYQRCDIFLYIKRSISSEVSQVWVRIRCPIGPTDSP